MPLSPSVLAAPKGDRSTPSSRYRVHDMLDELSQRGWSTRSLSPSMTRERRARGLVADLARAARGADVLLVQRPGRRREEELTLRGAAARARAVVVDVDDPVEERGPFAWALRRAALVVVASQALSERYGGRGKRCAILPTSLDCGRYARARRLVERDPERPVVGWIGDGPAYRASLVRMVAAAGPLVAASGWRMRVVGTLADAALEAELRSAASGAEIETVPSIDWQDEDLVARMVAGFDIGLAPARNAEGGAFKCAQYLAAGVVPIAEDGGEAARRVRLALGDRAPVAEPASAESVRAALERLGDAAVRTRLSEAGMDHAAEALDRRRVADRLDGLLRGLVLPFDRPAAPAADRSCA